MNISSDEDLKKKNEKLGLHSGLHKVKFIFVLNQGFPMFFGVKISFYKIILIRMFLQSLL